MKTAISIPDRLFKRAERVAKRLRISRSDLYARAVRSYLRSRDDENLKKKLDQVYATEDSGMDAQFLALQRESLTDEHW